MRSAIFLQQERVTLIANVDKSASDIEQKSPEKIENISVIIEEKKNEEDPECIEKLLLDDGENNVSEKPGTSATKRCHFMWPITPVNLEEEEEKYFKSGCQQNPQFIYLKPKLAKRMMKMFKTPTCHLLPLAKKILDSFMQVYGTESNYLITDGGDVISEAETKDIFQKYIDELEVKDYLKINYSYNTVSPTTITHDTKTGNSVITIGLPMEYRRNRIMGVLNHEIGTHFLRNYNDQSQYWYGYRSKYKLKNYLNTEEGLASINQLFHIASDPENVAPPFLFQSALYYYTCCGAVSKSFVELFKDLEKYIDDPKRRFRACVRAKRGLEDTAQLGGLFKDKVYFEGAVKILQKRKEIDLRLLYAGKISIDDVQRKEIVDLIDLESLTYPLLLQNYPAYSRALDRIAEVNHIDS